MPSAFAERFAHEKLDFTSGPECSGAFPARHYLLKRGRTEEHAMVEVDKILSWARVADCTDASARRARSQGFSDFEDALQAAAAETSAANWMVTRNPTDFARSRVPVLNPSQFLQRFPLPSVS